MKALKIQQTKADENGTGFDNWNISLNEINVYMTFPVSTHPSQEAITPLAWGVTGWSGCAWREIPERRQSEEGPRNLSLSPQPLRCWYANETRRNPGESKSRKSENRAGVSCRVQGAWEKLWAAFRPGRRNPSLPKLKVSSQWLNWHNCHDNIQSSRLVWTLITDT